MSFLLASADPNSPNEIARKRKIAQHMMRNFGRAQNVGQGVGDMLLGLGIGIQGRRLDKQERAGRESADNAFNSLLGGFVRPSGPDVAAEAMGATPINQPGGGNYRDAIASIESAGSGDYSAIGPTHPELGRALGRYQVMEANIGPWSKEALGRELTPDEFMADPKLQDAIFDHRFGGYVNEFGPEGAAQAWFAGPGGVGKVNRKDVLGTDVGSYGQRFMSALNQGQVPDAAENTGFPPPPQGNDRLQQLYQVLSNPFLNQSQKQVAGIMLQQELGRNAPLGPLKQAQLEKTRLETERLRDPASKFITGRDGAIFRTKGDDIEQVYGGTPDQPSSVEEYEYAKQNGFPGSYIEFQQAKKGKGFSVTTADGTVVQMGGPNSATDTAFSKQEGKNEANLIKEAQDSAKAAQELKSTVAQMREVAPNVGYTGPGGELYGGIDDVIGVLPGDRGSRGAFRNLSMDAQLAMTERTKGAITDREMGMFKAAVPGLIQTPDGNSMIMDVMDAAANRAIQRVSALEAWRTEHGTTKGFVEYWSKYLEDNPLIVKTEDGISLAGTQSGFEQKSIKDMTDEELEAIINAD